MQRLYLTFISYIRQLVAQVFVDNRIDVLYASTFCRTGLLKLFCSATAFWKRSFNASPLLESLDFNDTWKRPNANLKKHFRLWRNHAATTINRSNYAV